MGADNMLGNGVVNISNIISFWSYLISSNAHFNFHYILNRHINITAYDLVLRYLWNPLYFLVMGCISKVNINLIFSYQKISYLPKSGPAFAKPYVVVFFSMFNEVRWEGIVCIVDIGRIGDHRCLNLLFKDFEGPDHLTFKEWRLCFVSVWNKNQNISLLDMKMLWLLHLGYSVSHRECQDC